MSLSSLAVPKPRDAERQARIDLAAAFRTAARLGFHEGTCNHFSLALPGAGDRYLINPHGLHFAEIGPDDLLVVNGAGEVVAGTRPIEATAFFIHSRIHRARPDAACVLHTHMPYATALTMIEDGRIEPCGQNAIRFFERVGYDYDSGYQGLALDEAEGDRMVAALGRNRVLLLASHGVIAVGPNVAQAFDDLYYLERAAQVQVLAMSTGRPLRRVPDALARRTAEQVERDLPNYAGIHFAALKRLLDQETPGWAD